MANESERPIEKLLRAAAQKRRDDVGPPFELHPADRRLLQGEVARKFAQPRRQSRSFAQYVARLWPRLAGGVAILAVLCLAVWVLLPRPGDDRSEAFLAKNLLVSKDIQLRESSPSTAPPPATVTPPPAPRTKAEPAMVAYADTTSPDRFVANGQLRAAPSPIRMHAKSAAWKSFRMT